MKLVALLPTLILAVTFLAGCADSSPKTTPDDDLTATETTGVLRGVVVDSAIRPLPDVDITVIGAGEERKAKTGPEGTFGFAGLAPGTYFVKAHRLGYFDAQQSVDVVAGDNDPDVVRVLLETDTSFNPYFTSFVFEGFIECTSSLVAVCGAPNLIQEDVCDTYGACVGNVTNDRFGFLAEFDHNVTHIQAEMVWDTTQALSPELYFEMEAIPAEGGATFFNSTEGPSPIYATVDGQAAVAAGVGPDLGIWISVFSGSEPNTGVPVGGTVQQKYTMYVHGFYGYEPPSGWRFTEADVPQPPR